MEFKYLYVGDTLYGKESDLEIKTEGLNPGL